MARVYLETSFFSACVSTRMDVNSQSWRGRSLSWLKSQARRRELYISPTVIEELSAATYPNRILALELTSEMQLLAVTREVFELAQYLIEQKVMPSPLKGDALHVAVASFYGCDYVLSWNVTHLANPNKRVHLARVLGNVNKSIPMIVTPDVLWENSDE